MDKTDLEFTKNLTPAFLAMFVFGSFVLKCAADRMKDWEAAKDQKAGAPTLACWCAGAGVLGVSLLGSHLFGFLFLTGSLELTCSSNSLSRVGHTVLNIIMLPSFVCFGVTIFWLWRIFIAWFRWYFSHAGELAPLTKKMSEEPVHWHKPVCWTSFPFIFIGIGASVVCFFDPSVGLMGIFYALIGGFGIGSYCWLRGDLLIRAIASGESIE